ncbi:hypothetical protein Pcinc_021392 [Petrolisthes cinctipes]|uniref:Uncharacterized protein n=1 Tax=Petrolisthes cinctipes TaxID=88211 RepID=A0AAE1KHM5_PETCI|nr:hypothetical protein Pcinc_021392 [Petrolisthes cinctipes]
MAESKRGGEDEALRLWRGEATEVLDYLKEARTVTPPPPTTDLKHFMEASESFPGAFPINTARVKTHLKKGRSAERLTDHINSAYPLLHQRCLPLFAAFLHYKKTQGNTVERAVYSDLDLVGLVDRLLRKRPFTFFGRDDQYQLRDGTRGRGGFDKIGTKQEMAPLKLYDYLSYDEMKLSALLSVSSYSYFVNDGNRTNKGVPGKVGSFQEEGVIVGMVGARMKKKERMEWEDCLVTPTQNTQDRGYGSGQAGAVKLQHLWARMWGKTLPLWQDISPGDNAFMEVNKNTYLNISVYKSRMQLTAEALLAEAGARAKAMGKKAYVHVVGLGLGVWRASPHQDAMFVDAWGDALKISDTSFIGHVDFSWIGADKCQGVGNGQVFPGTSVILHFSRRALHELVPPGTLLVDSFAWDGNSLPGNEYWIGKLSSTGDGAAACSSGVAELHNVHINPRVCGTNLHVVGPWGVQHVAQYATSVLSADGS